MRLDLHPRARWWHMLRDPPTPPVFGPEISFSGPKAREPPANRGDRGRGNQVHVRVFPCNDVKRAEVWPSCPIPQRGSRPAASARLANVRRSVCGVTCGSSISPLTARFRSRVRQRSRAARPQVRRVVPATRVRREHRHLGPFAPAKRDERREVRSEPPEGRRSAQPRGGLPESSFRGHAPVGKVEVSTWGLVTCRRPRRPRS